jgi:hypothetical protein
MDLNFTFHSSDHLRYENGIHVSGPHGGAGRVVKIEPNPNENNTYLVTIFNQDGNHPLWQNNVQMAPKKMIVFESNLNLIRLRGHGNDPMGFPFSGYGITIHLNGGKIENCVLHMHDRNVDIKYIR